MWRQTSSYGKVAASGVLGGRDKWPNAIGRDDRIKDMTESAQLQTLLGCVCLKNKTHGSEKHAHFGVWTMITENPCL